MHTFRELGNTIREIIKRFEKMFEIQILPYAFAALEPIISVCTIEFHYGKHLKGYVDNLNKLIIGTKYENLPLEDIIKTADGAIFNNAGQVLNHNLYFEQFSPTPSSLSEESMLLKHIIKQWGSFEKFKEEFILKGISLFGSGWVWLSAKPDGTLIITQELGASTPITKGLRPILTFDVWEHAYYLDYQNKRADHLNALWKIVNWSIIEKRYEG